MYQDQISRSFRHEQENKVRRGSKNKNKLPQLHRRDGDDVCDTEMEMATKRWKVAHFTRDVLEAFMLILLVFMVGFWIRVGKRTAEPKRGCDGVHPRASCVAGA